MLIQLIELLPLQRKNRFDGYILFYFVTATFSDILQQTGLMDRVLIFFMTATFPPPPTPSTNNQV